ncbi:MAG TPA: hypothetical protein VMT53_23900 [Terriglobales bacterium]|nr:hypothetical protein [Terriglobales bacterium]
MKALLPVFLFSTLTFAQGVAPEQTTAPPSAQSAPAPPNVPSDQENARRASALLEQAIQALGGQAYLNFVDMTQQGRTYSFYHGQPNSAGILFWRFYKFPDKERVELTKQRDVAYVIIGDKGYEITYKGTTSEDPKVVADSLRRRAHSIEWVFRKWLNEPNVALFYDGPAVAAEKPADQITIMRQDDSVTIYLDSNTHLPIKKSFSWRDPTDKLRNTEDEVYDNYRPVGPIKTPFSITRFLNGDMSNQRFLNSASFNTGVSDSLFEASITYEPGRSRGKKK